MDMYTICRACLTTGPCMVPMDEDFLNQYNAFTSLNITMEDMPLFTCSTCFDRAKLCVVFREKCIESDRTLRKVIFPDTKENDNKFIIVKNEIKLEKINDDMEFLETFYNYGEDYVEPTQPTLVNECLNSEPYVEFPIEPESTDKDEKTPPGLKEKKNPPALKKKKTPLELKEKKPLKDRLCKRRCVEKEVVVENKLFCGICPALLKDQVELTKHLDVHKGDFACAVCKESLFNVPHMLGHRMEHVPKNQKMCHICQKKFMSSENSEFHYMKVHEMAEKDAQIQCKKCPKSFPTVRQLQKHLTHHAELKYKCDHCSKSFRILNQLRIHMGKHSTKRAYKCDLCDYTSKYHNGIYTHKIRKHTENKAVCKTCGRLFASEEKLSKHDCRHRQPVVCSVCGITFQAKGKHTFSEHMRTHGGAQYRCSECPATFRAREPFRAHADRHAGTPRQRCQYCARAFYSASVLVRHRRTHTGEKPYVCKICNRGFTGNYNLKVHMKVHGIVNLIKKKEDIPKDTS